MPYLHLLALLPGPSHSQTALAREERQQAAQSQDKSWTRPPNADRKFFHYPVAASRLRKPVRWLQVGEVDPSNHKSSHQVNGNGSTPAKSADPWLLGEGKSRKPDAIRQRLAWAPVAAQQAGTSINKKQQAQPRHTSQQAGQQNNKQQWQKKQQAATVPKQQAPPPSPEQYLRNQAQMKQQLAQHEWKKEQQQAQQAQQAGAQPRYTDLTARTKRKAAAAPQPVPQPAPEVVIPPDVTVRQLAQLLGRFAYISCEACLSNSCLASTSSLSNSWLLFNC